MSTINILVKDSAGVPVPAAYVNFTAQGVNLATLATDAAGTVQIDSVDDAGLLSQGVTMTVTKTGYTDFKAPTFGMQASYIVTLAKSMPWAVILGGLAIIGALAFPEMFTGKKR